MIVTNNPEVHEYSAMKMFEAVQSKYCHEIAIALAGYLLGEVGVNICEQIGKNNTKKILQMLIILSE
jgi:hypothetical protein